MTTILIIAAISAALLCVHASANEDLRNKNGVYYNAAGAEIPGVVCRGIDISTWQKDIDWEAVKGEYEAGVIDFVIIRCGYGDNSDENGNIYYKQDDVRFVQNADACTAAGIPFGIYLYSYACNDKNGTAAEHAANELEHVLRLIDGYTLSYPIFYDVEDTKTQSDLDAETFREIVEIFCGGLYERGYEVGLYSMRSWYTNEEKIGAVDFDSMPWLIKWIAEFNNTLKYYDGFDIWQATSVGRVNGIDGDVDIDYSFMPKRTAEHCYVTFDLNTPADVKCDMAPMHLNAGDRLGWLPVPECGTQKFLGWYTSPRGGRKVTETTKISSAGQLRLYAHWSSGDPGSSVPPQGEAPAAPDAAQFSVIRPMISGAPFSVNGITNAMEYRIGDGEWISGSRIRAVQDGQKVEIRYKATKERPAGEPATVYIHTATVLKKISYKKPTCAVSGMKAHWLNEDGRVFTAVTDYIGLPDTETLVVPPTGKHTYRFACSEECTVCGQTRVTEHTFSEVWHRRGNAHFRVCLICGREGEHHAHENTIQVHADPDCVRSGFDKTLCADCEIVISSYMISALGHEFEDGYCMRCGDPDPDYEPPTESVTESAPPETTGTETLASGTEPVTDAETDGTISRAVAGFGRTAVIVSSAVIVASAVTAVVISVRKKKTGKGGPPR